LDAISIFTFWFCTPKEKDHEQGKALGLKTVSIGDVFSRLIR
jgi:hypothetical protein